MTSVHAQINPLATVGVSEVMSPGVLSVAEGAAPPGVLSTLDVLRVLAVGPNPASSN
jgi:hypothetical protein